MTDRNWECVVLILEAPEFGSTLAVMQFSGIAIFCATFWTPAYRPGEAFTSAPLQNLMLFISTWTGRPGQLINTAAHNHPLELITTAAHRYPIASYRLVNQRSCTTTIVSHRWPHNYVTPPTGSSPQPCTRASYPPVLYLARLFELMLVHPSPLFFRRAFKVLFTQRDYCHTCVDITELVLIKLIFKTIFTL